MKTVNSSGMNFTVGAYCCALPHHTAVGGHCTVLGTRRRRLLAQQLLLETYRCGIDALGSYVYTAERPDRPVRPVVEGSLIVSVWPLATPWTAGVRTRHGCRHYVGGGVCGRATTKAVHASTLISTYAHGFTLAVGSTSVSASHIQDELYACS